ncbi:MAG: DNA primase [Rhabdochlamydiaceae bacterium]|nr:DNA primase [Rhabdochlamydiaceae bacterium]
MPIYSKESLDLLRQKIDLPEVLSGHLQLQRAGSAFKALCPFHEEKTPSFVVQRGDTHYHCFGCGAHGDAISFLMTHVKMGFIEAIEHLAERFQVTLEADVEQNQKKGPSRALLKQALDLTCHFYHFLLLHSEEGDFPLKYLYERGLTLDFIRKFEVGYAPSQGDLLIRYLREKGISHEVIQEAGLMNARGKDFFSERISFPIRDAMGAVIGFSCRKFREETFGGKYINTPETTLFKKSHVLFGLSYSRQRIAKEQRAIIVEGQIDALQLIHAGYDYTVAGQGTAFGEDHVKELIHLGAQKVYLALDGDKAGQEAAVKIGHLFQKKGVEVLIVSLPNGLDPDGVLKEWGPSYFNELLSTSCDYLSFVFGHLSQGHNLSSPSQKNEIVQRIVEKIRQWEQPVMVHESLRKLAEVAQVPESTLGVGQISLPDLFIKKSSSVAFHQVNPDQILETDLLRWLILVGKQEPKLVELARLNVKQEFFHIEGARRLYFQFLEAYEKNEPCDLLALGQSLSNTGETQLLSEIMLRKINILKGEEGIKETLRKILVRHWMEQKEVIRMKIQEGGVSDDEMSELAKEFAALNKNIPQLILPVEESS